MKIKNILIYILFQRYCVHLRETARNPVEGELSGGEAAKRKRKRQAAVFTEKQRQEQSGAVKNLQFFTAPQSKKEYENENNCAVCVTQPKDKHKM